jgi:hypothetical protein
MCNRRPHVPRRVLLWPGAGIERPRPGGDRQRAGRPGRLRTPVADQPSISTVYIEQTAPPIPPGRVSADQKGCVVRDRIELSTFRFSGGRSYRLSYLTLARSSAWASTAAVLTGFEPATSTLTGWRALQLLYRTMFPRLVFLARMSISPTLLCLPRLSNAMLRLKPRAPNGIRTRAAALKGRCPRPLDDGGSDGVPPKLHQSAVGD